MLPAFTHYSAIVARPNGSPKNSFWRGRARRTSHPSSSSTTISIQRTRVKRALFFLIAIIAGFCSTAQKVLPVTQSQLTSISLPAGSKADKRLLSVAAAEILLEMEGKKTNSVLKNTEVLTVPLISDKPYTLEDFITIANQASWNISPIEGEKDFFWLQQNGRFLLMYFSVRKKGTDIYLAEADQAPAGTILQQPVQTEQQQGDVQQNNPIIEQPINNTAVEQQTQDQQQNNYVITSIPSGFKYNTTNFDDGWTATEQADWVEVTKENIKVLLHYPKEGTIFPADPEPLTNAAWNILVAPRYSNLKNYKTTYISTYNRAYLGMGYATENTTGREVFIAFFRQGETGWIEFITPDKSKFIEQFKVDPETIRWDSETDQLIPLVKMVNYNKFAIDAADLHGKWTSDFTGIQQLYNVYSGNYAGMHINQSNEEFVFNSGNLYSWKLLVVSGMAGNAKFTEVKSAGTLTLPDNWQIHFTSIEEKARTYNAFWSCIKGARILNLLDAQFPGSGIYTKYGLAK